MLQTLHWTKFETETLKQIQQLMRVRIVRPFKVNIEVTCHKHRHLVGDNRLERIGRPLKERNI